MKSKIRVIARLHWLLLANMHSCIISSFYHSIHFLRKIIKLLNLPCMQIRCSRWIKFLSANRVPPCTNWVTVFVFVIMQITFGC